MEDNLDSVRGSVEQLDSSDLIQNWIIGVVSHVVGSDWWERVSLEGEYSSLEKDLVFLAEQCSWVGNFSSVLAILSAVLQMTSLKADQLTQSTSQRVRKSSFRLVQSLEQQSP